MPNQNNFRSDITTETEPRFFASRVVKNFQEGVLLEELPGSFGYSNTDTIEIHFYTLSTNVLMLSTTVSVGEGDILKTHIVRYDDGSYKTYMRIDFTELFTLKQLVLIPGEYKVVFNFFSDEIGSYTNRNLFIEKISPSKQEVQLAFTNNFDEVTIQENQDAANQFVPKYLTKPLAIALAEKILTFGVNSNDELEGVNYDRIANNIVFTDDSGSQTQETTINRIQELGQEVEEDTKNKINQFILDLFPIVKERIVINDDEKIQESEFKVLIKDVVKERFPLLQRSINDKIVLR